MEGRQRQNEKSERTLRETEKQRPKEREGGRKRERERRERGGNKSNDEVAAMVETAAGKCE